MEATEILEALRGRYHPPEWAFFEELRAGTGYDYGRRNADGQKVGVEKRLDAWAFHLWPSDGYQPTGFEIKVSRSDFLREQKKVGKTDRYMALCQFFYYVTPANLVLPREVPDDAGLIWVYPGQPTRTKKKPPHREMPAADWDFFAAICRRVGNAGWGTR